jgi:hypothetical protein
VSRSGESGNSCDAQYAGPHRKTRRQWNGSTAGSLVCHRSDGGRGVLLHLTRCPGEAANWPRGEAVVFALVEREGFEAAGRSASVLRLRLDPGVEGRSHLQVRGAIDRRSHRSHPAALRTFPLAGIQGEKLCRLLAGMRDDRARRSSAARTVCERSWPSPTRSIWESAATRSPHS